MSTTWHAQMQRNVSHNVVLCSSTLLWCVDAALPVDMSMKHVSACYMTHMLHEQILKNRKETKVYVCWPLWWEHLEASVLTQKLKCCLENIASQYWPNTCCIWMHAAWLRCCMKHCMSETIKCSIDLPLVFCILPAQCRPVLSSKHETQCPSAVTSLLQWQLCKAWLLALCLWCLCHRSQWPAQSHGPVMFQIVDKFDTRSLCTMTPVCIDRHLARCLHCRNVSKCSWHRCMPTTTTCNSNQC